MRFKPIDLWGRYGVWATLFLVVFVSIRNRNLSAHQDDGLRNAAATAAAATAITLSSATVVNFFCDRFASSRAWQPLVLKWLAWFVSNLVISFFSFGMAGALACAALSMFRGLGEAWFIFVYAGALFAFPFVRLYVHVTEDLREFRRVTRLRSTP